MYVADGAHRLIAFILRNISMKKQLMILVEVLNCDEEEARNILLKENYFFINGYRRVLMVSSKEKKFVKGATFDELYSIFKTLHA